MKLMGTVIGLAILFIASLAIRSAPFQEDSRQPHVYRGTTLKSRAVEAKAQGKYEVTVGVPSDIPQNVPSLDHALANFTVVIGRVIATQTVVEHGADIITWYKFRITATLSRRPPGIERLTLGELSEEMNPSQLLPISKDEIVVLRPGGTLVVDGVGITARSPVFPPFVTSQSYLLFLNDSSDRLAYVAMEAAGAFEIENGKLVPFGSNDHPVVQDMKNLYDNSLNRVQKAVQGRASK
jgi:hypothetical protein